jgi:hypothetical protein
MKKRSFATAAAAFSIATLVAVAGCSGANDPEINGTWVGTGSQKVGSVATPVTTRMTVVQNGVEVSGTFLTESSAGNTTGNVAGTFNSPVLAATFAPNNAGVCSYNVTLAHDETNNILSGTGTSVNCATAIGYEVYLVKQ